MITQEHQQRLRAAYLDPEGTRSHVRRLTDEIHKLVVASRSQIDEAWRFIREFDLGPEGKRHRLANGDDGMPRTLCREEDEMKRREAVGASKTS